MNTRRHVLTIGPLVLALCAFESSPALAYEPKINYILQCMGCHTPDGSGVGEQVPSIRETLPSFAATSAGRRFLVQVPGSAQSTLTNGELAELLNWMIQTLSEKPPLRFEQYTEKEVAEYRGVTLVAVRVLRERLLREHEEQSKRSDAGSR
jgi:hypothetical protein